MSRTVSARIKPELHEELRERCNKVGCSINDFIEASITIALHGDVEFDFGDENETSHSENNILDKNNVKKDVIQV